MAMYRSGPTIPADIITYRYNTNLVYVRPADNYEQAIDFAQKEFPELAHTPRKHITFTIVANLNGERRPVRISESAWTATIGRLLRGEVIDVRVKSDDDQPPKYLEVPLSEKSEYQRETRHRSAPSSRTHSRSRESPSPARSHKASKSFFGLL